MSTQSTVSRGGTWAQVREHQLVAAFAVALAMIIVGAGLAAWLASGDSDSSVEAPTGMTALQEGIAQHDAAIEGALGAQIRQSDTAVSLQAALDEHEALIEGVLQTESSRTVVANSGPSIEDLIAQHEASIAGVLGFEGLFEPGAGAVGLAGPTLEELIAQHEASIAGLPGYDGLFGSQPASAESPGTGSVYDSAYEWDPTSAGFGAR